MSSLFDKQTVLILVNFVIIMLYYYVLELNKMKFPLLKLVLKLKYTSYYIRQIVVIYM